MRRLLPHDLRLLIGLTAVLLAITAMVGISLSRSSTAGAAMPVPVIRQINGIYLSDGAAPGLDAARARVFGVRVTTAPAELVAAADAADAILVDSGAFARLDPAWLAGQLQQGRLIVALNTPASRLQRIPGYRPEPITFREDWGGQPFFSYIWQYREGNTLHAVSGSDRIADADTFLRTVYTLTPAGQAEIRSRAPAPPPLPTPGDVPAQR